LTGQESQGWGTSWSGLYREASPERGVYFAVRVYERAGKFFILIF